jgi:hypothetical protein
VAQVPEDLVQTAFLEVYAAQQNLLSQGPTADPLDIEQLSHILQQVLPAAQPQHEALLQDVLARQQQLLAMQDACLAELEGVGASIPTLKLPVAFCQQRPSAPPTGISVDSASSAQAAQARQYKHQESQQWVDGFTPRTNSTSSNSLVSAPVRQHAPTGLGSNSTCHDAGSAGGQAGVFRTAEDLQKLMSQEDRLAVAAAAYGSYDCPQKSQQQLLEASRGKAGARSGRGRGASAASTVEVYTGQLISPTGGRQHGAVYVLDDGLDPAGFEGGAAPAYAADSSSGSEVDVQCRPLLSYMNVQETAGSSHSAHARLQQVSHGRCRQWCCCCYSCSCCLG